jgi:hypothetical protein
MINLKYAKHRAYVAKHFPGINPEELTGLTCKLFQLYVAKALELGFDQPIQWTHQSMKDYLDWRLRSTTLGLEVDRGNRFGLVTERTLLRWVRARTFGLASLKIPFGLSDWNYVRTANPTELWDVSKVT